MSSANRPALASAPPLVTLIDVDGWSATVVRGVSSDVAASIESFDPRARVAADIERLVGGTVVNNATE